MRLRYPDTIRIVRLPCTGKVDVGYILRAFEKGADGVYVVGCMEGDCRYNRGNLRAKKRVAEARRILNIVGIGGERVQMFNLSSAEGPKFAQIALDMTEKIKAMGPNPVKLKKMKKAA
ncbi:hydrogenase iron-sulfur subunit [bacterium]|nr:hydrogenase iron-sulfur subunit [bacterium]NCP07626.1 hydrogenase iron-sulfur subunit [bacterium]OIP40026.1 MAG: F420-nonreducing hydrogenase [Desulfobacteraceae bacterium CG2_30_51_40]